MPRKLALRGASSPRYRKQCGRWDTLLSTAREAAFRDSHCQSLPHWREKMRLRMRRKGLYFFAPTHLHPPPPYPALSRTAYLPFPSLPSPCRPPPRFLFLCQVKGHACLRTPNTLRPSCRGRFIIACSCTQHGNAFVESTTRMSTHRGRHDRSEHYQSTFMEWGTASW